MKLLSVITVVVFTICVSFVFLENRKIAKIVQPLFIEWSAELDKARHQNLTTEEFVERHKAKGSLELGALNNLEIVDRRSLSSPLCNSYTLRVFYSSDGEGGARLTLISGKGEGLLCFI
jgi:hypothetical protein